MSWRSNMRKQISKNWSDSGRNWYIKWYSSENNSLKIFRKISRRVVFFYDNQLLKSYKFLPAVLKLWYMVCWQWCLMAFFEFYSPGSFLNLLSPGAAAIGARAVLGAGFMWNAVRRELSPRTVTYNPQLPLHHTTINNQQFVVIHIKTHQPPIVS